MWDDAPDGDAELEAPPGRAIDVLRDCSRESASRSLKVNFSVPFIIIINNFK